VPGGNIVAMKARLVALAVTLANAAKHVESPNGHGTVVRAELPCA
jgi:hypothetical protein